MIAIDLDGTLLSPNGKVSERTKAAVHGALTAGLLVCFATGRNWTESKLVLDAVDHYPTAVFVGGAIVMDTKQRTTLHRTLMQPTLAAEVCQFFEQSGHAAWALQDIGTAGLDYLISAQVGLDIYAENWIRLAKLDVHRRHDLATHTHEHTIRVSVIATDEVTAKLGAELNEKFGSRVVHHTLKLAALNLNVMEVFDPAVNKWQGLLHVAAAHHIDPSEIIAIGDDVNDLPMIRNAGLGVAMGNSKPEVQAVARRVIGTNSEDGLARFLEELVIEHEVEPLRE